MLGYSYHPGLALALQAYPCPCSVMGNSGPWGQGISSGGPRLPLFFSFRSRFRAVGSETASVSGGEDGMNRRQMFCQGMPGVAGFARVEQTSCGSSEVDPRGVAVVPSHGLVQHQHVGMGLRQPLPSSSHVLPPLRLRHTRSLSHSIAGGQSGIQGHRVRRKRILAGGDRLGVQRVTPAWWSPPNGEDRSHDEVADQLVTSVDGEELHALLCE